MPHTEEVKIILPDKINETDSTPLILSIGPSLSMLLPMILMLLLGSRLYGGNQSFMYMTLITGAGGALTGVLWAFLSRSYKKRDYRSRLYKSRMEFKRYLEYMDEYLSDCAGENRSFMYERHKGQEELTAMNAEELCYRYLKDEELLCFRIGKGSVPFQMKISIAGNDRVMLPDENLKKARELAGKYEALSDVPVTVSLSPGSVWGMAGYEPYGYVMQLMLQAASVCPCSEVKLALIYDEEVIEDQRTYESMKFCPHMFIKGKKTRLCAGTREESMNMLSELYSLTEKEKKELKFIFFILNEELIKGELLYEQIGNADADLNISAVFIKKSLKELPKLCTDIILLPEQGKKTGRILDTDTSPDKAREVLVEEISFFETGMQMRKIADRYLSDDNRDLSIPGTVPFLDLFDVSSIEEIDSPKRYKENRTDISLRVPVGIAEGNTKLFLDLHEKAHGPHGLAAGTTGAGKSELLQSYLISLCLSFSPEDINFFLIDYKGGGTGNYINELPHCAGSISNLSGSDIGRAMKAISSENKRRQTVFSRYGVNHIDAYTALYREGAAIEAMPHLILIIDEFAELKKEEPEFMQQIISLSAVGRSLGIHLILATQKPAGVVDEKIFSNSRFRLCLKVQDKQDSQDMLKRSDAAYLTRPGQCYLQVGNDELFRQFQTGYCGMKYIKDRSKTPRTALISASGKRLYPSEAKEYESAPVLLKCLVEYVKETVKNEGMENAKKLWMDELPEAIEGEKELVLSSDKILLGMYDDPYRQKQGYMYYDPKEQGHFAAIGGPASGKSTLLMTILPQLKGRVILIDVSQGAIHKLKEAVRCMGALYDNAGLDVFFYHLLREFKRRKEEQDNKESLYVVIDNFAPFYRLLPDAYSEALLRMVSEGISVSMYFIMTAVSVSDIPSKIFGRIRTTFALFVNDRFQYGDILRQYRLNVYPKEGIPGRCLYKIGENILEGQIIRLNEECTYKAAGTFKEAYERFPMIPEKPGFDEFMHDAVIQGVDEDILPIGYSLRSGYIRGIRPEKNGSFLIAADNEAQRNNIMSCIEETIKERKEFLKDCRIVLIKDLAGYLRENGALPGEGFVIAAYEPHRDAELMLSGAMRLFKDNAQGIALGASAAAQRIFAFEDISYSELNARLKDNEGFLKISGVPNTIKVVFPMREGKEAFYDYD